MVKRSWIPIGSRVEYNTIQYSTADMDNEGKHSLLGNGNINNGTDESRSADDNPQAPSIQHNGQPLTQK